MEHESNDKDRKKIVHNVHLMMNNIPFDVPYKSSSKAKFHKTPSVLNIGVNSIHHQVVSVAPKNAKVAALHDSDKRIEALVYEGKPIITVQWHPEEIEDIFAIKAINYLLKQ